MRMGKICKGKKRNMHTVILLFLLSNFSPFSFVHLYATLKSTHLSIYTYLSITVATLYSFQGPEEGQDNQLQRWTRVSGVRLTFHSPCKSKIPHFFTPHVLNINQLPDKASHDVSHLCNTPTSEGGGDISAANLNWPGSNQMQYDRFSSETREPTSVQSQSKIIQDPTVHMAETPSRESPWDSSKRFNYSSSEKQTDVPSDSGSNR
jgi:hypothetical protein